MYAIKKENSATCVMEMDQVHTNFGIPAARKHVIGDCGNFVNVTLVLLEWTRSAETEYHIASGQ